MEKFERFKGEIWENFSDFYIPFFLEHELDKTAEQRIFVEHNLPQLQKAVSDHAQHEIAVNSLNGRDLEIFNLEIAFQFQKKIFDFPATIISFDQIKSFIERNFSFAKNQNERLFETILMKNNHRAFAFKLIFPSINNDMIEHPKFPSSRLQSIFKFGLK